MMKEYSRPETDDRLYMHDYNHANNAQDCDTCDSSKLVIRQHRCDSTPKIYYGRIASGNQVIKDGITRERLRRKFDVLRFEMEASGLMERFCCLVVRGICDYSDSHKNKRWQEYAAAVAAAYAKEFLTIRKLDSLESCKVLGKNSDTDNDTVNGNGVFASHKNPPGAPSHPPAVQSVTEPKKCLSGVAEQNIRRENGCQRAPHNPLDAVEPRPRLNGTTQRLSSLPRNNNSYASQRVNHNRSGVSSTPRLFPDLSLTASNIQLIKAAQKGDVQAAKRALSKGADPNAKKDQWEKTPLHYAAERGHEEVVQVLIENGADANAQARFSGVTPLIEAASNGHAGALHILLYNDALPDAADKTGRVALHEAAENGHLEVVCFLTEKGANPSVRDRHGRTALKLADQKGYTEIVSLLLGQGAR